MAQTLTATASAAAAKRSTDLRYLLKIEFVKPYAKTLRLSDQHLPSCGGAEWQPLVLDWGSIATSVDIASEPTYTPESVTLVLDNARPIGGRSRFTDYIHTTQNPRNSFEFANAKATLYLAFSPTAAEADLVTLGVFYLEEPQDAGQGRVSLTMSDVSLAIENAIQMYKINSTDLSNAPPSSLNQYAPVVFGDLTGANKKIKLLPVVAGKRCVLTAALTVTATTITVDSTSGFPSTGGVLIEGEIATYTGTTSTTFTGVTRGARSTTAAAHSNGSSVYEVRTGTAAYRYIVSKNILGGVDAISNVYVDGVETTSALMTKTLGVTSLVSGQSFAMVDFDVADTGDKVRDFHVLGTGLLPDTAFQNTTAATNTGDGIEPPDPFIIDVTANVPTAPTTGTQIAKGTWDLEITVSMKKNINDGDTGQPESATCSVAIDSGNYIYDLGVQLAAVPSYGETGTPATGTVNVGATYPSVIQVRFSCVNPANHAIHCTVHSVTARFVPDGSASSSADSTVGAVLGELTALVRGIEDDGSGTISGSAALLLENPADIAKAIVTQLYQTTPGVVIADAGTTWATSRTKYAALGYEWAGVLERQTFSSLRRMLGLEGRALLYFSAGKVQYRFLDDGPTEDFDVTFDREVAADSPATLRYGERTRVVNSITAESQLEPATGVYGRSALWEDLTQVGFSSALPGTLSFQFIQDTTTADGVTKFWRDQWKDPRFEATFRSWWNLTALELGDVLTFVGHPVLAAHGDTLTFRVVRRRLTPGKGFVEVTVREAPNFWSDKEVYSRAYLTDALQLFTPVPHARVHMEHVMARRDPRENANAFGRRSRVLTALGG